MASRLIRALAQRIGSSPVSRNPRYVSTTSDCRDEGDHWVFPKGHPAFESMQRRAYSDGSDGVSELRVNKNALPLGYDPETDNANLDKYIRDDDDEHWMGCLLELHPTQRSIAIADALNGVLDQEEIALLKYYRSKEI